MLRSEIHKLINSVWNKEELRVQWKDSIILPIKRRLIKLTIVVIVGCHCYKFHTKFYSISFPQF
jgi:hypothetical protein